MCTLFRICGVCSDFYFGGLKLESVVKAVLFGIFGVMCLEAAIAVAKYTHRRRKPRVGSDVSGTAVSESEVPTVWDDLLVWSARLIRLSELEGRIYDEVKRVWLEAYVARRRERAREGLLSERDEVVQTALKDLGIVGEGWDLRQIRVVMGQHEKLGGSASKTRRLAEAASEMIRERALVGDPERSGGR